MQFVRLRLRWRARIYGSGLDLKDEATHRRGVPSAIATLLRHALVLWAVGLRPPMGCAEEAGTPDRIAVFREDLPVCGAAACPEHLGALLQKDGRGVEFLNSAQLADPKELDPDRFDVLILPYGASFPVQAANNLRRFLGAGGKFLSTGGYAFDALLERTSEGWRPYQPPAPPASVCEPGSTAVAAEHGSTTYG